jgi:hypothetical protein
VYCDKDTNLGKECYGLCGSPRFDLLKFKGEALIGWKQNQIMILQMGLKRDD